MDFIGYAIKSGLSNATIEQRMIECRERVRQEERHLPPTFHREPDSIELHSEPYPVCFFFSKITHDCV